MDAAPKESSRPDIDALFENLEEPDAETHPTRAFDLDAYRREAGQRAAATASSQAPTSQPAQSSSPSRGSDTNANGRRKRKDTGDDEPKERKPLPKLDHARLLGKDGFPALVAQSKRFTPRGKGHEVC